jgi:hypothetical protein
MSTPESCLKPSFLLFTDGLKTITFNKMELQDTAKSVQAYFEGKKIRVLPWCARSPDLNPIENIWAWMDRKMLDTNLHFHANLRIIENIKK